MGRVLLAGACLVCALPPPRARLPGTPPGRAGNLGTPLDTGIKAKLLVECGAAFDKVVPSYELNAIVSVGDVVRYFEEELPAHGYRPSDARFLGELDEASNRTFTHNTMCHQYNIYHTVNTVSMGPTHPGHAAAEPAHRATRPRRGRTGASTGLLGTRKAHGSSLIPSRDRTSSPASCQARCLAPILSRDRTPRSGGGLVGIEMKAPALRVAKPTLDLCVGLCLGLGHERLLCCSPGLNRARPPATTERSACRRNPQRSSGLMCSGI